MALIVSGAARPRLTALALEKRVVKRRRAGYPRTMRAVFLAATIVSSLGAVGCIALPFATPPVKGSLGGRAYIPALTDGDSGLLNFQIGVNPLQLFPDYQERRFDFGVGYVGNTGDNYYFNGAYLELTGFPWVEKLATGAVARASISAEPTIFVDKYSRTGAGLGGKLGLEFAAFADGPIDSISPKAGIIGGAFGEGGLGVYFEGFGARVFDDPAPGGGTTYFSIGGGLSFRLPAAAGLLWAIK
jgi:hypothetical protein